MGYLRVIYVKENLINPSKDFNREIETFPLKVGKYRLKKHPLFVFWILGYSKNTLTFGVKNSKYSIKVNQYTFLTYKKTKKKKIDVFFEIMDEEWVEEEKKIEEVSDLKEIPNMVLKIHQKRTEVDTYSKDEKESDFELPAQLDAKYHLDAVSGDLVVKKIISENEVLLTVTGHYGKDIVVTSDKVGIYEISDSYGYNDNFRAFSIKLEIQLTKK